MGVRHGERLPAALLSCEVLEIDGNVTTMGALVRAEPTLFVFVRQFGCAGCSQRLTELLFHLEVLGTSGVAVVVVGCGTVEHARELHDRFALGSRAMKVVTDPSLRVHGAAGLVRSYWGVLGAKGTWNLVRAMANGHRNVWGRGDFYQLGGTILLDHEGKVVLHHVERHLGESLPLGEVADRALALLVQRAPAEVRVLP